MSSSVSRHEQILAYLGERRDASMSDIATLFGDSVSIKTLQRDLKDLVSENKVSKSGAGRGTTYYISEANRIFEDIDPEEYFATDYKQREAHEIFNFDIFSLLENKIFTEEEEKKLNELQNEFLTNFSKYDSQTLINKEFERIMIEFSWKSSAIEGNTYTLLATEALIKENVPSKGKTEKETRMILNHKDAFNESIQNKNRFLKLDYGDIEYIHSVLTKGLEITKNIRSGPVRITGTKYKPLDNTQQLKEALENMVALLNKKESVFEKAFLTILLISYIQPFEDGNKRTARMFSNAILLAHGSVPLSYRIVDPEEYKKASLFFYEINNISYFKRLFIEQFEDSVKHYFN